MAKNQYSFRLTIIWSVFHLEFIKSTSSRSKEQFLPTAYWFTRRRCIDWPCGIWIRVKFYLLESNSKDWDFFLWNHLSFSDQVCFVGVYLVIKNTLSNSSKSSSAQLYSHETDLIQIFYNLIKIFKSWEIDQVCFAVLPRNRLDPKILPEASNVVQPSSNS